MRAVGSEHRARPALNSGLSSSRPYGFAYGVECASAGGQHASGLLPGCRSGLRGSAALRLDPISVRRIVPAAAVNGYDCGWIHRFDFLVQSWSTGCPGLARGTIRRTRWLTGCFRQTGSWSATATQIRSCPRQLLAERLVRYATASQSASITASTAASELPLAAVLSGRTASGRRTARAVS